MHTRGLLVPALLGLALAGLLAVAGHGVRAAVLAIVVVVVTGVRAASHGALDRVVRRTARGLGRVVSTALFTVGFVVVALPLWVGRQVLGPWLARRARRSAGWQAPVGGPVGDEATEGPASRWTFVPERRVGRTGWVGPAFGGLAALVGWIVLVVAIDVGVGTVYLDRYHAAPVGRRIVQATVGADQLGHRPEVDLDSGPPSTNIDRLSPAMAASPWAADYFREQDAMTAGAVPYELYEFDDARGRYINIRDGVRRSWAAPASTAPTGAAGRPTVVFFGGSTMFGQGQRDLHSPASEVARLAARDGLAITPVNRGERGWTVWQEFHAFEYRSSLGDRADLAVFYDGANEDATKPWLYGTQPVEFDHDLFASRFRVGPGTPGGHGLLAVVAADLRAEWARRSVADRTVTWARAEVDQAAGASPASPAALPSRAGDAGAVVTSTYRRARDLIDLVGREHRIPITYFWQPERDAPAWYLAAGRQLAPGTIDLTAALDGHDDLYLPDGTHTNETGARLVAATMWEHLRPQVEAWYRSHGR